MDANNKPELIQNSNETVYSKTQINSIQLSTIDKTLDVFNI